MDREMGEIGGTCRMLGAGAHAGCWQSNIPPPPTDLSERPEGRQGARTLHHLCGHTVTPGTLVGAIIHAGQKKEKVDEIKPGLLWGGRRRKGLGKGLPMPPLAPYQ